MNPLFGLIVGRSTRSSALEAPGPGCRYCGGGPMQLVRSHKLVHLLLFPLFSWDDKLTAVCRRCGATAPGQAPPGGLPPLPFLHRRGFILPLMVVFAPCLLALPVALVNGVRQAVSKPEQEAAAPAQDGAGRLRQLERHLQPGRPWGDGEEAAAMAAELALVAGDASAPAAVAVQVVPGPTRRVVAVVRPADPGRLDDGGRRALFHRLRGALQPHLAGGDQVALGVKARILYDLVAERPAGEELWILHARSTPSEVLERALMAR